MAYTYLTYGKWPVYGFPTSPRCVRIMSVSNIYASSERGEALKKPALHNVVDRTYQAWWFTDPRNAYAAGHGLAREASTYRLMDRLCYSLYVLRFEGQTDLLVRLASADKHRVEIGFMAACRESVLRAPCSVRCHRASGLRGPLRTSPYHRKKNPHEGRHERENGCAGSEDRTTSDGLRIPAMHAPIDAKRP